MTKSLNIVARIWNERAGCAEESKWCKSWQAAHAWLNQGMEPGDVKHKTHLSTDADGTQNWFLEVRV